MGEDDKYLIQNLYEIRRDGNIYDNELDILAEIAYIDNENLKRYMKKYLSKKQRRGLNKILQRQKRDMFRCTDKETEIFYKMGINDGIKLIRFIFE